MARSIDTIQQTMLDAIATDSVLAPLLTSTSKTAIFRLFTRILASCAWTIEVLFDTLKQEINDLIALLKPHSLLWYANIAKKFQFGYDLPLDSDTYDNSSLTDDQITASQVVKFVAVVEQVKNLRIKVAGFGTDLQQLPSDQFMAFTEYMSRVKDAGVKLQIDNLPADQLQSSLKIYYDPLILNADGQRLDGTNDTPVQSAFKTYLQNLPFNGTFVLAYLIDALQKVEGVVIPTIVSIQAKYGALPFTSINVMYVPDAGYMRFSSDGDLTIEFIAQSQLQ